MYVDSHQHFWKLSRGDYSWMTPDMKVLYKDYFPEDIDLNLYVQQGLRSSGFDQGRYMIDADRSSNSEHLLHHFHSLVFKALTGDA